ncbi:IS110 family transposase [Microlunatus aurantiacus]
MAIPGVGPLVAAKILGETHDARHFRSAAAFAAHAGTAPVPASTGNTHRHRSARGGNRQLNHALFTIAMVQARWPPKHGPTSPGNGPRARPAPRPADA